VSILLQEIIVLKLKECRMVFDITMRVSKTGESKSEIIGVSVTAKEKAELEKLAADTERSVSYWAGKYMREGWAAHKGAESKGEGAVESLEQALPPVITARKVHTIGKRAAKKNSKAS
jgi:hypothetical protein